MAHDFLDVEWDRLSEPQPDGYDTAAFECCSYFLQRTPQSEAPRRHIIDGSVAVCVPQSELLRNHRYGPGDPDAPGIDRAVALLSRWPAAYCQFRSLIDVLYTVDTKDGVSEPVRRGSSSHSLSTLPGRIFATVYDGRGLAQAFVHELAHHKLFALGVDLELASRIIANQPSELYPSPIRAGVLRPMTAILHAQYAFIHVTALDVRMIACEQDGAERAEILQLLARNVPRVEFGHHLLLEHAIVDDAGSQFLRSFILWSERVLEDASALLLAWGKPRMALDPATVQLVHQRGLPEHYVSGAAEPST